MPVHPFIRGKTQQEKNESIEQLLKSISRRAVKRAVVYIPPVPLLTQCSEGVIGNILIPFKGTLRDIFLRGPKVIKVVLTIITDATRTIMEIDSNHVVLMMEVDAGTLLQFEGEAIIATAVYPEIEEHKAKQFLLEEILSQEEKENAV